MTPKAPKDNTRIVYFEIETNFGFCLPPPLRIVLIHVTINPKYY